MENIAIILIIALIVFLAGGYIYKEKKSGKKCIGCPDSATCSSGMCEGCSGCCNKK